jgi:hypothetical protein
MTQFATTLEHGLEFRFQVVLGIKIMLFWSQKLMVKLSDMLPCKAMARLLSGQECVRLNVLLVASTFRK